MITETPNLNYIKEMSAGDLAFEEKLISIIKEEFPQEKQVYFENINGKNYKLAADNVHKLKHKISILGLEKSYAIAVNYEGNLIDQNEVGRAEFETLLQIISQFIETL